MKSTKEVLLKKVAEKALSTAKKEADSACLCFCYQPAMPEAVKKLRKSN